MVSLNRRVVGAPLQPPGEHHRGRCGRELLARLQNLAKRSRELRAV
jgi:hypothetical protein